MAAPPHLPARRERGAALVIVLAFVVLLTGLILAYFSRTTSDRQVAHSSFNQTKADQIAASGMDLVIGGLRQEISGPPPTPTPPTPPYVPATNAAMLPIVYGNPAQTISFLESIWQGVLQTTAQTGATSNGSPFPPAAASAIRIYNRYFYMRTLAGF